MADESETRTEAARKLLDDPSAEFIFGRFKGADFVASIHSAGPQRYVQTNGTEILLTPEGHQRYEEWQPIDNAPKDGRFLIGGPTITTRRPPWHVEIVAYRDSQGRPVFGNDSFTATHWKPLPAAPPLTT